MSIITRGFRDTKFYDLTDPVGNTPVTEKQIREMSHDATFEVEEITHEDNIIPNINIRNEFKGTLKVMGDIQNRVHSQFVATVKTPRFFLLDHVYLIVALSLDVNNANQMLYHRWLAQLVDLPKKNMKAGEINPEELTLKIVQFGGKNYAEDVPYIATADGAPGPIDPLPTADFDPVFTTRVPDATKTIAQAEIEIGGIVNPE